MKQTLDKFTGELLKHDHPEVIQNSQNPKSPGWDRMDQDSLGIISLDKTNLILKHNPIDANTPIKYYNKNHDIIEITTEKTIQIPDDSGLYYVVYDDTGDLLIIDGINVSMYTMKTYAFLASVIRFKDPDDPSNPADNGFIDYLPEQHSYDECYTHHAQVHFTTGSRYGAGIKYIFDEADRFHFQKITEGTIWDEDIRHNIPEVTEAPFAYKLGASGDWHISDPSNLFGFIADGDTYCSYNRFNENLGTNGEWELKESESDDDFFWLYTLIIPFAYNPRTIRLLGQNAYPSRATAKAQVGVELRNMILNGLPNNEYIIAEAYLIRRNGKIQTDVDGHYFTPIYSHNVNSNITGGSENTTSTFLGPKTPGWDRLQSSSLGVLSVNNKTVSIASDGSNDCYYYDKDHNRIFITNTKSFTWSAGTSQLIIYLDDYGNLIPGTNISEVTPSMIANHPLVALGVYYADSDFFGVIPFQHGWDENYSHHSQILSTVGTRYEDGLELDYTSNSTTFNKTTSGNIWATDIKYDIPEYSAISFTYKFGNSGDFHFTTADNKFGYIESGNTYISYNEYDSINDEYKLSELNDGEYAWTYFISIPFVNQDKMFKIIGHHKYTSIADAKAHLVDALKEMNISSPSIEFIVSQAVLLNASGEEQAVVDLFSHYFNTNVCHTDYIPLEGSEDIEGNLIPSQPDTYSLGSSAMPWKDLYVSSGSVHIGDTYLTSSGEVLSAQNFVSQNIGVKDYIKFASADAPEYEGMVAVMGYGGLLRLQKMSTASQYKKWADYNNNDISVTTSNVQILSAEVDEDVSVDDGAYSVSLIVTSTSNINRTLYIESFKNGTSVETKEFEILRGEIHRPIEMTNYLSNNLVSGDNISIEVRADGTGLTIEGATTVTKLVIVKNVQTATEGDFNYLSGQIDITNQKLDVVSGDVEDLKNNPSSGIYDQIIDMANETNIHEYEIPQGMQLGTRLLIQAASDGSSGPYNGMPLIVRPHYSELFDGLGFNGYAAPGLGVMLTQVNNMGSIDIEKTSSSHWKIRSWSGKWVIEGIKGWFPMNTANQYKTDGSTWNTVVQEQIFNQSFGGDSALFVQLDSPYSKSENIYGNDVIYGVFEHYSLYTEKYGYAKLDGCYGLNPFTSVTSESYMEIWLKRKTDSGGNDRTFVENCTTHNNSGFRWYFDLGDYPAITLYDSSGNVILDVHSSDKVITDGNWHRLSVLRKDRTVAIYVDGVQKGIATASQDISTGTSISNMRILQDIDGNYPFIGNAKDLVIMEKIPYYIDIDDANATLPDWNHPPHWLELTTNNK